MPNVQLPKVAKPLASVFTVAPVMEPPPDATVKVTATPDTGLLLASVIFTLGAIVTVVFTVAFCPSPDCISMLEAAPATITTFEDSAPVKLPELNTN